jgi:hypothetical protein
MVEIASVAGETLSFVSDVTSNAPSAPSVEEVRRIAAIADPAVRNLAITECYSRLAAAVAARTGAGANWCTYATWASRQAGRTIRGEDLYGQIELRLRESRWLLRPVRSSWRRLLRRGLLRPETRLGRLVAELHTPFDAVERASEAVARGNKKVFDEIGAEFARYLDACAPDAADDSPAFRAFGDGLRDGDPPDGQRYLRAAFTRYQQLCALREPGRRAELALLANLEIGLHEQTRLDPEIREAMDAASATNEDLGRRALAAVFPSSERWWSAARRPAAATVGVFAAGLQRGSSKLARELLTDSMMVLSLPGRVLLLGANIDDAFPDELRNPTERDLVELLARFEPVPPAADDCGVRDWSDFAQRMHYIVHLFRAFHLDAELARAPFTPEQVKAIARGVVPDGEL